ncbi:MAG: hypothetical protein Q7S30_03365 [Candidatus Omnitrophota bacterium]|nr:hypothetical protein [Candidatus Omnitrophota bacterium]
MIPFQIIGYGFLPPDDALWHSAKVISGKNWSEVLVLRSDIKIESHPGWHAVLGFVHRITKCDTHSLVLFSVISLFILFSLIPIFFLRYPESWLLSMLTLSIATSGWISRLVLGRPYIVTMAALLVMFLLWPKLKSKKIDYGAVALLIFVIAMSTWIHRTWYILLIPAVSFLLAREWRASLWIIISSIIGIFIGASFTGHPILFIKQTIFHLLLVSGSGETQDTLVSELRPCLGDFTVIILVSSMLFWRSLRGRWDRKVIDNPVFIVVIISFVAMFITRRVWVDVGMVALALWIANEFEDFLASKINRTSAYRALITIALAVTTYLSFTTDANSRWSGCRPKDYLSSTDPEQAKWLPGAGGIVYSDDMGIFFRTVFKNPHGNWRYILGSEAAIMPEDDLKILRNIQRNRHSYTPFEPWVKKMRPEDRLIIGGTEDCKPKISELEWKYAALGTWVGRKPQGANR